VCYSWPKVQNSVNDWWLQQTVMQHNTVNKQCQSMVTVQLSTDTEEQILKNRYQLSKNQLKILSKEIQQCDDNVVLLTATSVPPVTKWADWKTITGFPFWCHHWPLQKTQSHALQSSRDEPLQLQTEDWCYTTQMLQLCHTRLVSGLSHSGQSTNFLMNPSSKSCSLSEVCDPFTM